MSVLSKYRVAVAFVLAPILGGLLLTSAALLQGNDPRHFLGDALVTIAVLWAVTAILAVPLYLALRARNWLRWFHALAAGALCAAVVSIVAGGGLGRSSALATLFGGGLGLLFWVMAIFRNPRHSKMPGETA